MSIDRWIQQANPSAIADKLIGQDFLTLALLVIVVLCITLALFVYMNFRRQTSDDKRQDSIISLFTDDKSPFVKNAAQTTAAIEAQTAALIALGVKTDNQTSAVSSAIEVQTKSQNDNQLAIASTLLDVKKETAENTENIKKIYDQLGSLESSVRGLPETWAKSLNESRTLAIDTIVDSVMKAVGELRTEFTIMISKQQNGDLKRSTGTLRVAAIVNTEET